MTAGYPNVAGYQIVDQLGGGGFSTVWRAVNVSEKSVAACKVVQLTEKTTDQQRKTIEKEMRVHSALSHENVLRFISAIVVEMKHQHKYFPGIYMLLELAGGGDLFDKIVPDVGVSDDVAHYYFNQLTDGMSYIHSQGVCHRDLKPENILLDGAGTLKISDFGLSAVFKLKETGKMRLLTERCGSLPYVAPELANNAPYQAEPIDIWGLGVILFTLMAGNTPWDEPTRSSPEYQRYNTGEIFNEDPWNRLGHEALSLLRGLLCIDPEERMTISDVHQHPWCMSQFVGRGSVAVAERLTEQLHTNGDMSVAAPRLGAGDDDNMDYDVEGDQIMMSMGRPTQFTQTLMLFSQTQSGVRHTPHLTRFYASLGPSQLLMMVKADLEGLNVQCRLREGGDSVPPDRSSAVPWLRIGGYDARKMKFKGWVIIETFVYRGSEGSFCVMQRDEGNPISWRQLWKALIMASNVSPYVMRK